MAEEKRRRPLPSDESDDTKGDEGFEQDVRDIANEAVSTAFKSFEERITHMLTLANEVNKEKQNEMDEIRTHLKTIAQGFDSLNKKVDTNTKTLENLKIDLNVIRQDNKQDLNGIKQKLDTQTKDIQSTKEQINILTRV